MALASAGVEHDRERLVYLFGEDALADLDDYDLDAESDVIEVVDRFLPMPNDDEGARSAVRTVAVRQILNDDPPAAWQAVVRMRDAGLERERVLGQLAMVISESLVDALSAHEPVDPARLTAGFDALPVPSAEQMAEALVAAARADPGLSAEEHVDRAIAALGSAVSRRIVEPLLDHVLDRLIEGPLHWLPGDLTVVYHDTIAGRTFTHRFNDLERDLEMLTVSFDLAGYGRFDTVRLLDGREVDQFSVEPGHLAWRGPDGWLGGFEPGQLLAVTAEFDPPVGDEPIEAAITIVAVTDEPAMTEMLAAKLRAAYDDEQHEHGLPVSANDLIVWLCHCLLYTSPSPRDS